MKNSSLWEALMLEKFGKDCLLLEEPQAEEEFESASEEKGAAETTCNELATDFIHCLLHCWRGRRQRKLGVKLIPERKEGWRKGILRIGFTFCYLIRPHIESVLLTIVSGE